MKLGKIFSRALKYPLNVQVFIIMMVVNFVFSYSGFYLVTLINPADVTSLASIGLNIIPYFVASVIITIFLMALYVDNAAKYFSGSRKSLSKSIAAAKKKFLRLLGTQILVIAIIFAVYIPILFISISIGFANSPIFLIGNFAGITALFIVAFFVFLAPYIAVLDKFGVFSSIKASVSVVKNNKLSMLAFWVVYMLINLGINLLSLPVVLATVASPSAGIALVIWQSILTTYTTLFAYSAFTNFYLNVKKK